ncbi:glycosyltransferase [Streptomyces sp. MUM 178J]|uniref:glycosyltransferase n=1 Tax=Streptomyces sp. MUM 178J TaxID=2791991 RepID=UPI001F044335|nr:glycosyltransferase [Streptomyces sp. MUM 178J]WRQ80752.1 glycosyltransferase [Streptomyces sp. MUM 178J]
MIIPVHNRAPMLPATLRPWAGRSDCQVIVVDDASTDNSAAVAAAHGCSVIRLTNNQGPAAARNEGIRAASGERIIFLDADIVVDNSFPDALAAAHQQVQKNLVLVGLRRQMQPPQDAAKQPRRDSRELLGELYSYNLARHPAPWALCFSCVLSVPRGLLGQVQLANGDFFDSAFRHWGLEDIELGLRLDDAGAIWSFALGVDSDHQYHDRTMTPERFEGWRSNLNRLVERHPRAATYGFLSEVFDPSKGGDFLAAFQEFAGPPAHSPHAVVTRLEDTAGLDELRGLPALSDPDVTVYAISSRPSPTLAAACAALPETQRIALFPEAAWQRVGQSMVEKHQRITNQEPVQ